jgi:hypothetical protein
MKLGGVSLSDYQAGNDYNLINGSASVAEVNELMKALQAGEITGRDTTGLLDASGAPLKVESLEGTLKSLTFDETTIKLWKRVPKMEAYNTVEEYLRYISPGSDRGGFVGETELPEEEDSIYQRAAVLVKFMGVTKSLSLAMTLVNTAAAIGNIMQREIRNGSLWILRRVDKGLIYADSKVNDKEFDGFYRLHRDSYSSVKAWYDSGTVIDMRGGAIQETDVINGTLAVHQNFGNATLLMAPPVVTTDISLSPSFLQHKLIAPNTTQVTAAVMGQKVNQIATQNGVIDLDDDIFMARGAGRLTTDAATSPKAPNAPIADAITPLAAVADTAETKFGDTDGDYFYAVAARNQFGESVLTALSNSVVAVSTTQSVSLKFATGGGAYPATGYVIYRSKVDPSGTIATETLYPIFEVSLAELADGYDGGSAGIIRDRNRFIAGCEDGMLLQANDEVWSFKQLAPLMKLDLALLSQAKRFMVLLYGAPALYAPKKFIRYINIGRLQPS